MRLNPVLVWLYRAPLGNSPRGNLNEGKYGKSRRSQGNLSHNGGLSQLSGQVHVLCSSASAGALPTCYGALIIVQHVCGRRMLNIVICSGRFFSPLPIKVFCRQRINPDSPIGTFRPYGASRRASRAGWTSGSLWQSVISMVLHASLMPLFPQSHIPYMKSYDSLRKGFHSHFLRWTFSIAGKRIPLTSRRSGKGIPTHT